MPEFYQDDTGKVMAREAAGGTGGGVTSFATREATPAEAIAFHEQQVAVTEAAAVAAKDAHKAHMEERAKVVAEEEKAAADAAKAAGTAGTPDAAREANARRLGLPPAATQAQIDAEEANRRTGPAGSTTSVNPVPQPMHPTPGAGPMAGMGQQPAPPQATGTAMGQQSIQ